MTDEDLQKYEREARHLITNPLTAAIGHRVLLLVGEIRRTRRSTEVPPPGDPLNCDRCGKPTAHMLGVIPVCTDCLPEDER